MFYLDLPKCCFKVSYALRLEIDETGDRWDHSILDQPKTYDYLKQNYIGEWENDEEMRSEDNWNPSKKTIKPLIESSNKIKS